MKTYALAAPLHTHFRPATCEQVDCANHLFGWRTVVDVSTELGQRQAHYIEKESGRRFTKAESWGAPELVEFVFEAGQRCFATHQQPLERDPVFLVRDGDWRAYGPARVHVRPGDWVEDMQESLDRTRRRIERG